MNLTWLMSNAALAGRYLKMVTLVPVLIPLVKEIEATGLPGVDKKASVLKAIDVTTDLLTKRGYLPEEVNSGLDKVAGDLIDVLVEVFHVVGIFKRRDAVTQ